MNRILDVFGLSQASGSLTMHGAIHFFNDTGERAADERLMASEGTRLRERADIEFSTAFLESRLYKEAVLSHLAQLDRRALVLDLGMGDGRQSATLLAMGFENILGVDCNPQALQRFNETLSPAERARMSLLCADFSLLDFPKGHLGAVVSFEGLCWLNHDFDDYLKKICGWLRPGGLVLHAEPALEGALAYALACGDFPHVKALAARNRTISGTGVEYRVFAVDELHAIQKRAGFNILSTGITPALNSLAALAVGKSDLGEAEKLEILRLVRNTAPQCLAPRCHISRLVKREV